MVILAMLTALAPLVVSHWYAYRRGESAGVRKIARVVMAVYEEDASE